MAVQIGSVTIGGYTPGMSLADMRASEQEQIDALRQKVLRRASGELVGEIVQFPAADGYAEYMVASEAPLELIHLAVGDGWQIPVAHLRGLDLEDVRANVERRQALERLFANKAGG